MSAWLTIPFVSMYSLRFHQEWAESDVPSHGPFDATWQGHPRRATLQI